MIAYIDRDEILLILASILVCLLFLVSSDYIYLQYDAYYYASIADSISLNMGFKDITTIPSVGVRTPQNAIVLLHLILINLGIESIVTRLGVIALVNSIAIGIVAVIIKRICLDVGLGKKSAILIGASIPLSFYYQIVLLQAINDAIFLLLSVSVLWIIFTRKKSEKVKLTTLGFIALVINHFRLAGVFSLMSGMVGYLLQKKYKLTIITFSYVCLSLATLYVAILIMGFGHSGIGGRGEEIIESYGYGFFYNHIIKTIFVSMPEALIKTTQFTAGFTLTSKLSALLISMLIISVVFYSTWLGVKNKDFNIIILIVYCGFILIFFQLHPAQPTRYIIPFSIFLPILLIYPFNEGVRIKLATLFLLFSLTISIIQVFTTEIFEFAEQRKIYSTKMQSLVGNADYNLYSYFPRETYFLLGKRSGVISIESVPPLDKEVVVVGPDDYLKYILDSYTRKYGLQSFVLKKVNIAYTGHIKSNHNNLYFPYERIIISTYIIIPKKEG